MPGASGRRGRCSHLEHGTRLPRIDTLAKLAGALEVDPGELFDGIKWEPGDVLVGRFVETEVPGLGTVQLRVEVERHSHD